MTEISHQSVKVVQKEVEKNQHVMANIAASLYADNEKDPMQIIAQLRVLDVYKRQVLMSMSNVTSAGQFAGLTLILNQGTYLELAMTTLIINLRYSLMSLSLSQKIGEHITTGKRAAISFGVTDEIFAVSMQRHEKLTPAYFAGVILIPYLGWAAGTFLGAYASNMMSPEMCIRDRSDLLK